MFSVALLGMVAIFIFSEHLNGLMSAADIPAPIQSQVMAHATNLAKTTVPEAGAYIQQQIRGFIDQSFIHTFRWVMLIATGLALLSAFVSWRTIAEDAISDED